MRTAGALAALALLGAAAAADSGEVTFNARVDEEGQVFVDVENDTAAPIVVTTFVLRFFGAHDRILEKAISDCDDDCAVAPGATESFGPFEAPEEWETVRVDDVFYEDTAASPSPGQPRPRNPLPRRSPAAPRTEPSPLPTSLAEAAPATPEQALRELYKWLVRGEYARAARLYVPASGTAGAKQATEADYRTWAQRETKNATVVDLRLLEPVGETATRALVEILFADGSKAKRRVQFRRDADGWSVESIEAAR